MPGLFAEFKTDKDLETQGVQFTYTAGDGKPIFRVRLARAGGANKKYDQVREEVYAPYRRLAKLTEEMQSQAAREVFSRGVVVKNTWETFNRTTNEFMPGIEDETGEVVPATAENIARIMELLPDLYGVLVGESMSMHNYKNEAREQDSKN